MNKYLLLALLFMSALTAVSQDTIMLEGQVLNDTIDKANLTIVNLNMRRGTITSSNGQFSIETRLNDTINISAVQYEPRQFVVNETMYNRGKITLYLIPKITELDQVNISNTDLTGDITKDIGSTTYERTITPTDLGIPENTAPPRTVEERRYHTAISSGGGIPLDGLINSITGRLKMLKKHIEVSRFEKLVQESRYTFSDSIYMNELNIEKEYIEDFVYYTFEDPKAKELVDANNALGLLDFMIKKSAAYKALMKKD
ncbi:hypothetical protein [Dokdonia sp. Asnod1-B02]|jgi:hypothetical protein|uniref:hypothetical protein n=1 Tax=Dokdonia sp. Asnod1-B02 TaxID=3160573 RepID=UPI003862E815